MMNIIKILGITLTAILFSFNAEAKLQILAIQSPAAYDNPKSVPYKVITECTDFPHSVSRMLGRLIVKHDYAKVRGVDKVDETTSGKAIGLRIVEVHAMPGGMYSGPKILKVRADLYENGAAVASKLFSNYTRGSVLGEFKNCRILDAEAMEIANNIFRWLRETQGHRKLPEALVHAGTVITEGARETSGSNSVSQENANDASVKAASSAVSSSDSSRPK